MPARSMLPYFYLSKAELTPVRLDLLGCHLPALAAPLRSQWNTLSS